MSSERTRPRNQPSADLADFHIRVLSSDGRWIVQVSGEVDAHTATRLRDSLDELTSGGLDTSSSISPTCRSWEPAASAYWSGQANGCSDMRASYCCAHVRQASTS